MKNGAPKLPTLAVIGAEKERSIGDFRPPTLRSDFLTITGFFWPIGTDHRPTANPTTLIGADQPPLVAGFGSSFFISPPPIDMSIIFASSIFMALPVPSTMTMFILSPVMQ